MTAMPEIRTGVDLLDSWTRTGEQEKILAPVVESLSNSIVKRQRSGVSEGFKFERPKTSSDAGQASRLKMKTLRRVRGFLIESIGAESKVAFEHQGELIQYYLPSGNLEKAGITAPNQPFEMDEIEFRLGANDHVSGYRFKPLAKVSDAVPEHVLLDAEHKEKLQVILHHFKRA